MQLIHPIRALSQAPARRGPSIRRVAATALLAAVAVGISFRGIAAAADAPAPPPGLLGAHPTQAAIARPDLSLKINSVGDGEIDYLVHLAPAKDDPRLIQDEDLFSHPGVAPALYQTNGVHVHRDHLNHTERYRCTAPGLGHPLSDGRWEVELPDAFDARALQAGWVDEGNGQGVLRAGASALVPAAGPVECRVTLPGGATNVELVKSNDGPYRLGFTLPAVAVKAEKNAPAKVEFHVGGRPLISCMAKSYADDKLGLWAGRAWIKNTGSQPLSHFRVKFRMKDYSPDWSEWYSFPNVLPGETVVEPYYPILDVDKLALVEGTRKARIEAQYECTQQDGVAVTGTDTAKLDIFGHNDIPGHELDDPTVAPIAMASYSTKDDPIIRRVAAMVSGQLPGGIPQYTRDGTKQFMRELYRFMLYNRFAYEAPGMDNSLQHVKFGRDVVLDRSGTCIDLAIFYNSVCEAVGIKTKFYITTNHVFPVIFVPAEVEDVKDANGNIVGRKIIHKAEWIPVEATDIGNKATYEQALTAGLDDIKELAQGPSVAVNIPEQRARGVHSMELPRIDENVLTVAGISAAPPDVVGVWQNQVNNVIFTSKFYEDGKMWCRWNDANTHAVLFEGTGRYTYDGKLLTFSFPPSFQEGEIVWTDAATMSYRTVKSSIAGAVGAETVMKRIGLIKAEGN